MNLNYLEETIRTSKYLVCLAGMEFMREQNVAYHRDSDESYRKNYSVPVCLTHMQNYSMNIIEMKFFPNI